MEDRTQLQLTIFDKIQDNDQRNSIKNNLRVHNVEQSSNRIGQEQNLGPKDFSQVPAQGIEWP